MWNALLSRAAWTCCVEKDKSTVWLRWLSIAVTIKAYRWLSYLQQGDVSSAWLRPWMKQNKTSWNTFLQRSKWAKQEYLHLQKDMELCKLIKRWEVSLLATDFHLDGRTQWNISLQKSKSFLHFTTITPKQGFLFFNLIWNSVPTSWICIFFFFWQNFNKTFLYYSIPQSKQVQNTLTLGTTFIKTFFRSRVQSIICRNKNTQNSR